MEAEGEGGDAAEVARARAVAAAMRSTSGAADPAAAAAGGDALAAAMAELDMEHYDDESDGEGGTVARMLGSGNPGAPPPPPIRPACLGVPACSAVGCRAAVSLSPEGDHGLLPSWFRLRQHRGTA
jgi:hypothetical protein